MYLEFYGLREKPFNLTPDSNFLFLSEKHREAIAHIKYGIIEKKGFVLITGEIGAGKTTLCRAMLRELDKEYKIALILNSMLSPTGLLRAIITDLGIANKSRIRHELMDTLGRFLIGEGLVILVIDEAQNLSIHALEQIRLLGNLETEKEKLIQIILVGQPELNRKLASPKLRQLNQRIAVRYHIQPLNREETKQYICHRLRVAGDSGKIIFHEDSLDEIYNYSGGIPRMVNIVCDYCLVGGYVNETSIVNKNIVEQAIKESQGVFSEPSPCEQGLGEGVVLV